VLEAKSELNLGFINSQQEKGSPSELATFADHTTLEAHFLHDIALSHN